MKNVLILLLLLLSCSLIAQNKGVSSLLWNESKLYESNLKNIRIPNFEGSAFLYNEERQTIEYKGVFLVDGVVDSRNFRIHNVQYSVLNPNDLGELRKENIPNSLNEKVLSYKSRNQHLAQLTFNPIFFDNGVLKRVNSFEYEFTYRTTQERNTVLGVQNSNLATGEWFRFYIEKSGVYKISRSFLQQLGMNMTNVNPKHIKIFGNGGQMLALSNAVEEPLDLEENAITVIGEEDGVFDSSDYILFYAVGMDKWNAESATHTNLYSDRAYYYITAVGGDGKRISNYPDISGNGVVFTTYDDYQYYEKDLINIGKLGRTWFGEQFGLDNVRAFDFSLPGIDSSSKIKLTVSGAFTGLQSGSFQVAANGVAVGVVNFSSPGELYYSDGSGIFEVNPSENLEVKITFNNGGIPTNRAFLDYIVVESTRKLQGFGKQFEFSNKATQQQLGIAEYHFSNASSISEVWDVTDIYNVQRMARNNQNTFSVKAEMGSLRKFVAIDQRDFYLPKKESNARVANQNLKGTIFRNNQGQFQDIDYLIITPNNLKNSATRLAQFHQSNKRLNVKVVSLEEIYQEFSAGKQDIAAIRNFIKYVYFNASSEEKRVKYVNLFGDASYDYKNRITNNTNIVPIYHAVSGRTVGEQSHCSDEFFVMMDANEGGGAALSGRADIAVGRMIVSTVDEAEAMVQKVLDYHDLSSYGNWRNNYTLVADDPDPEKTGDAQLQYFQNKLAETLKIEKPFVNVYKIFIDAYVQESAGGGFRYPKAREAFFDAFQRGSLVINYLGHGGEDGLAVERIWDKTDSQNLFNQTKLPLFITLTCEFSRFDNPNRVTAGELIYLNKKGGAIAMITTVREIGQSTAQLINEVLTRNLYAFGNNEYPSMAEALRLTKITNNSNVIMFIGDPAVSLSIPKSKVVVTHINDVPVEGAIDDLKSLGKVKISGQIVDENGNLQSDYQGALAATIYDKDIDKLTLRNDNVDAVVDYNGSQAIFAPQMPFKVLGETIFRGNASVKEGLFEFSFVVPRDIRIPLGTGRISMYAKKNNQKLDHTGYSDVIKVGGINENAAADNTPPTVRLYMNDETFVSGGNTNDSPILLAFMEDENGMSTAAGIGHDMVAILDGDEANPYILNDFYETELDDYTKGKVRFPFRNLEPGLHTLTFKAWDVYNNMVTSEIQFVVVGGDQLKLSRVLNYPNPFVNYTQFWFNHNRPFEPLEVQVQVMTITGKVVWTKNQIINTEGFLSRDITWDGRDDFGDRIGKGVYIYKLTVRSTITNSQAEKFEKLVIL